MIDNCRFARPVARLQLADSIEERLIMAAQDARPVEGLTHRYYRYPARFSPVFVAEAIHAFTEPGDLVADPFVGGGTSAVEAVAARRRAIGTDVSALATFVATAKTLLPSQAKLREFERVLPELVSSIDMQAKEPKFSNWVEAGYLRNMGSPTRWRLRKAISQTVATIESLNDPELELLTRCMVLRTAHWALDGRKRLPNIREFRAAIFASARLILDGATDLASRAGEASERPKILHRSAIGIENDQDFRAAGIPRLIITSPPYPGVHVLYHRWQVDGRKESPAPFFIANALDGSGDTYYTMGGRRPAGLRKYFEQLKAILASAAKIANSETTLVQIVAFSQPEWQLAAYLAVAEETGWTEFGLTKLGDEGDGRLWRHVPNRKWYADQRGHTSSAREVVLFHKVGAA
jgi:hypothetical protein